LCHLGSRKIGEIGTETTKKPVDFVDSINWATDCVKLITQSLEGTGIGSDWMGAALHQLEVIFEADFTGLGAVAEGVFQGSPYLTVCGEANDFSHCFLCKGGEEEAKEALVGYFPCQVFVAWCLRGGGVE